MSKPMTWLRTQAIKLWRWWFGYQPPTEPTTWYIDRDGRVRIVPEDRKIVLRAKTFKQMRAQRNAPKGFPAWHEGP